MEIAIYNFIKKKGMKYIDDRKSSLIWYKLKKTSIHLWNISDHDLFINKINNLF